MKDATRKKPDQLNEVCERNIGSDSSQDIYLAWAERGAVKKVSRDPRSKLEIASLPISSQLG